jgi:parallel beta-helix repeat protein
MKNNLRLVILLLAFSFAAIYNVQSQKFVHPGINQTPEDMAYMKKQVLAGAQPWKESFDLLKKNTSLTTAVKPFAHVKRGPYARPNIGGGELERNAHLAYNCALIWYISDNKSYADKAIEILNSWSPVLWDFDFNDAKLLAGLTGHYLCNAAEILKYTKSDWKQKDIDSFTKMLMTVYYPLLRYYFPNANGNWNGMIIQTILSIGIFTDNREMFDNAVDNFLHSSVNGSIFKYIFPSGQCQESMRDQGHVQLGLGEFAGAARVAYTQGVDLFSAGNNRIALGFEYTSKFLLGVTPHCYGIISERAKNISANNENYEYIYRHYTSKGISVPYTKRIADSIRSKSPGNALIAFRVPSGGPLPQQAVQPSVSPIAYPAGALDKVSVTPPEGSVFIQPGQSIQEALNSVSGTGKWVVAKAGVHTFNETLKIPGGVTLAGEGLGTILFLDPASGLRDAIVNKEPVMHDVTIRDLVIDGNTKLDRSTDPNSTRSFRNAGNRGGIMFQADNEGDMKNIELINVTVQNCTFNGVFLCGITGIKVTGCDFNENGSSIVPGPKLQHNLLITHSNNIIVSDSRLDTSPYGSGIAFDKCSMAKVTNCEIARNGYYGVLISECTNISLSGNLVEGNDRSGVMIEYLFEGSENIGMNNNQIQYNNGFGIESYGTLKVLNANNSFAGNGNSEPQVKISPEKYIIMK